MKYELNRLGSDNFEHLIQSLVRGVAGNSTIIFGDGPDGQREAVIECADHMITGGIRAEGLTIVQAKFKSPDGNEADWNWLRKNLKHELDGFREKRKTHLHLVPRTYLFFTNITLTPMLDRGVRDRAEQFVAEYKTLIPNIHILGIDDIRAMLDNNRDVARRYMSFIMPGDVLTELHDTLRALRNKEFEHLIEYARHMFREDSAVRLEQAGDASSKSINIRNVYIDLEAVSRNDSSHNIPQIASYIIDLGNGIHKRERLEGKTPDQEMRRLRRKTTESNIVLIGNAGQGKSTLCQYLCQLYRAALLKRYHESTPEIQFYLAEDGQAVSSSPLCERFPVMINLKRYAAWINRQTEESGRTVLAYMLSLINGAAGSALTIFDLRRLMSGYSWAFFFDGLDEVPASSNRGEVLKQIQLFLETDLLETACDCLVICTSRPQGYDDAFSTKQYTHFVLQDMSPALCQTYIDRLLTFLEDNSEARERYRNTLYAALGDPMVSKLMTTPLYTAIIVLLVKLGGTPPNKRYALFKEYITIVIKREIQKEMLPSLHDEFEWITPLHAQIGFLLQNESESADNAAAELTAIRCKQIIARFLEDEEYDGDIPAKVDRIYDALVSRLSFLSAVTGADHESAVIFPLRSIQEYFAAEWLISFNDDDKLVRALEIISVSAYWRNVYLFVAGFFAKNPNRKNINDELYLICQRNNGDEYQESPNPEASRIALQGSRLALDLLCDNLFSKPRAQKRYMDIAALLLDWHNNITPLIQSFLCLPHQMAAFLLENNVVPRIRQSKDADTVAFSVLWSMAANGNEDARRHLDELIGDVSTPKIVTLRNLLARGFAGISDRALQTAHRWLTEDMSKEVSFHLLGSEEIWGFLTSHTVRRLVGPPSSHELRRVIYFLLADSRYRHLTDDKKQTSYPHPLAMRIIKDPLLHDRFYQNYCGKRFILYDLISHDGPEAYFFDYARDFRAFGLDELAALTEFLRTPSSAHFKAMLTAYNQLLPSNQSAFIELLEEWHRLFRDIAKSLKSAECSDSILAYFDEARIEAYLQAEQKLIEIIDQDDFVAICLAKDWEISCFSYESVISQELLCKMFDRVQDEHITPHFISFLYNISNVWRNVTLEMQRFVLDHFPSFFQTSGGTRLALKVFEETPLRDLILYPVSYPEDIRFSWIYHYIDKSTADALLERVDQLIRLGDDNLLAYALLPLFFMLTSRELLLWTPAETLVRHLYLIEETGNEAARLGCLLRLLVGPIQDDHRRIIWDTLLALTPHYLSILHMSMEPFSLDGKLLVYQAAKALEARDQQPYLFIDELADDIFDHLEGCPVEQNELLELSRSAHQDRNFE